jgi:DNA-binding NtrC family response regulator
MRRVVLIVEDEFLVRLAATAMVEEAGFEAVEAANADEAIAVLEARPDIRVVFTDIVMPGSMDGLKLAAHVRGKWPFVKIIATSGHHRFWEGNIPDGVPFLPKPYTHAQISTILRRLTGAKRVR